MKELWYFQEVLEASWVWPCCVLTKVWWWDRQTDRQLEAHKGICFTAGWRASDVVTDISLHRHFPSPGRLWRSHWSSLRWTTYLRRGRCVSVSAIRKYRGHLQLLWHPQGFLHYNIDIAPTTVPLISTIHLWGQHQRYFRFQTVILLSPGISRLQSSGVTSHSLLAWQPSRGKYWMNCLVNCHLF